MRAVKPPGVDTIHCGRDSPGVAFYSHSGGLENPALVGGSGSCLRVVSHDVMGVVGRDIYSGL